MNERFLFRGKRKDNGEWVDGSNYAFKDICPRNMEVTGNIRDNPELLEVER